MQSKCNASAKQNDAKERKEKEIKENNNNSFLDRKESEKCFSPKDSFGGIWGNYQKKIADNVMEKILNVWFEPDRIYIRTDADEIYSRPLEAFPLLKEASNAQREEFTIELGGEALRWPAIDEDIHITSFYDKTEPEYDNEVAAV